MDKIVHYHFCKDCGKPQHCYEENCDFHEMMTCSDCLPISSHHPDCQCNRCIYGDDLATWAFHASEY